MKTKISALILLIAFVIIFSGCGTADRNVQTPVGSRAGDEFGGFDIIGISSKISTTGNLNDAHNFFDEKITINVPVGTYLIIPAVRGWMTGYGAITPNDLSNINDLNATITYSPDDQHLGIQSLNIYVDHISAVDTGNNTQTAVIGFTGILADNNGDNKWFGVINYNLIFLGKKKALNPTETMYQPLPPK